MTHGHVLRPTVSKVPERGVVDEDDEDGVDMASALAAMESAVGSVVGARWVEEGGVSKGFKKRGRSTI